MVRAWLKQNGNELGLLLTAAVACAISGTTGVYLVDTGINFNFGWLLYNGYRPFTDIASPLMPLCGLLTELGYRLYGVNYLSSVIVSTLLCAAGILVIADNLKTVFDRWVANAIAVLLILGSLAEIGVLYYNHLALLFEAIILTYTVRKVWGPERRPAGEKFDRSAISAWLCVALLSLTKLHLGILLGAFCVAVELATTGGDWRKTGKYALFALAVFSAFLLALGISPAAILDAMSIPERPALGPTLARYLQEAFSGPRRTFSEFVIAKGVFISSFLLFALSPVKSPTRRRANLKITAWFFGIVGLDWLHDATSPDIAFKNFYFIVMALAALALLYFIERSQLKTRKPSLTLRLLGRGYLLSMLLFQTQYSLGGYRKAWSMEKEGWLDRPLKHNLRVERGFFRGILIKDEDFRLASFVQELSDKRPGPMWFGMELEMFYPATGRLPPRPWPLWFHPGTSVRRADFGKWRQAFLDAKFETVVLSKLRMEHQTYIREVLEQNYKKVEIPKGLPILVFERR